MGHHEKLSHTKSRCKWSAAALSHQRALRAQSGPARDCPHTAVFLQGVM